MMCLIVVVTGQGAAVATRHTQRLLDVLKLFQDIDGRGPRRSSPSSAASSSTNSSDSVVSAGVPPPLGACFRAVMAVVSTGIVGVHDDDDAGYSVEGWICSGYVEDLRLARDNGGYRRRRRY